MCPGAAPETTANPSGEIKEVDGVTSTPLMQPEPWDNKMQSVQKGDLPIYPNGLYSSLGIDHGSTDSQLKNRSKQKRREKNSRLGIYLTFFLSIYLYLQANVALVTPSPWTLFTLQRMGYKEGKKLLIVPSEGQHENTQMAHFLLLLIFFVFSPKKHLLL